MRTPKMLYILAEGGRARFVELTDSRTFKTIRELDSVHIHEPSRALGGHEPARVQESASPTRHSIEPRINRRRKAEQEFIVFVAENIDDEPYDAIVIAAPPPLIGIFKESLNHVQTTKLAQSIAKDLTKIPDFQLKDHFPHLPLAFAVGI